MSATSSYAHLTFGDEHQGSIEPGKLADLVVLSEDILDCSPERIRDMDVAMTILGGEIVYQ